MKKRSNLLGNGKAMALTALVGMSSVFGLSCYQQDDQFEDPAYTTNATLSMSTEMESDTVFVNNFKFNHDNCGTTSKQNC